jgi:hypothetical protein
MTGTCACCDQPGRIIAFGWREACYTRWRRAGKPDTGPPPARLTKAERLAEYELLVEGGENSATAGRRLGLKHERTIRGYETERKAKGMSAITCRCCARQRPLKARGWCTACYMRWTRAGRPADGPPVPPPPRRDTTITCVGCGQAREHVAHGWCIACYMRWYRAGQPDSGPPAATRERRDSIATCSSCGQAREHAARGWCVACYLRWYRSGRPDSGPPDRRIAIPSPEEYAYRIGEYAFLLSCGESQKRAVEQVGISIGTARKYNKALNAAQGQEAA